MKLSIAVLTLLSATVVSSRSFLKSSDQIVISEDKYKVPGDNPLVFCADPKDYLLDVTTVELSPNPPVPGKKLSIKANGTFTKEIEDGATVHLEVKWNTYITLINTKRDLCEELPRIDIKCPIKKGDLSVSREADIPSPVPKGKYDVLANVLTADDKEVITCMQATVHF